MTVLVLGATGHVGPHVVQALLESRAQVRVLARDEYRACGALPAEVDVAQGDYTDTARIREVLTDCSALFLLTAHGPEMADEQLRIVTVAHELDVRIVKLSGTSAAVAPDGPNAGAAHWRVEQALETGRVPFVILRPNAFMQGLLVGLAVQAKSTGTIANPLGGSGLSFVDCADIGRAAAAALLDDGYDGGTYVLTGPEAPTYQHVAEMLGDLLGQPVGVVDVTPDDVAQSMRKKGAGDWDAEHLRQMLSLFRDRRSDYVTDHVRRLTGRDPTPPRQFLEAHCLVD